MCEGNVAEGEDKILPALCLVCVLDHAPADLLFDVHVRTSSDCGW